MRDQFDIPTEGHADIKIFNMPSTTTNLMWTAWEKPRGKSMLHAICIGGGAGGGGGFTGIATSARGGGGSGGSSGTTRVTVPLAFLPDTLYIQVGAGGQGVGSGGGTAGSGILSYISMQPGNNGGNILATSGSAGPTGGGTGTGAAVGAAGTAGSIAVITNMFIAGLGQFAFIAGQAGAAGGAVAGGNGSSGSLSATSVLSLAGTGGGGTTSADFNGGSWTNGGAGTLVGEATPAVPVGSVSGSDGPTIWKPLFFYGGTGGGASNASVGGNGGNGSYGAGGGGGGGGTTGGRGGNGGTGIIIMIAW